MHSRLKYILSLILVTCCSPLWSKTVTDTLATKLGDKVIITYSIVQSGTDITVSANSSDIRFLPTDKLRKRCDGNLTKLKVIVFDRVGGYAATKFTGEQPKAFGMPSNVSHSKSYDGYYILGESSRYSSRRRIRTVALSVSQRLLHFMRKRTPIGFSDRQRRILW